ncbi:hypothetical protein APICC_05366 [Apis cerana cerana]|uniref:Uncharacterized protein n=1 Tax=Apis cerana cerana TaxID=94128 RepID=A0A2A3E0C7_APICC|nr:hypothetical protein APICC_05366 [Apis cerana cerana]
MKEDLGGVVIIIDIAKAFDTVPHKAISKELEMKGVLNLIRTLDETMEGIKFGSDNVSVLLVKTLSFWEIEINSERRKPDMVIKDHEKVYVVDVTIRYENNDFLMKTYKKKCKKYKETAETLKQKLKAIESSIIPVVIGCRGIMLRAIQIKHALTASFIVHRSSIEMPNEFFRKANPKFKSERDHWSTLKKTKQLSTGTQSNPSQPFKLSNASPHVLTAPSERISVPNFPSSRVDPMAISLKSKSA